MKTYPMFLFFAALILLNCSKTDDGPSLPPATQTGENTFGCYVDGRLLIPRDGTGTFNSPDYGMRMYSGPSGDNITYREINVHDFVGENGGSMDIHIVNLHEIGEGNFQIGESNCETGLQANPSINIRTRYFNGNSYDYYCSVEGSGYLNITRSDTINLILSGTFNFRAVNENQPNDTIEISQGRFDINRNTLPYTEFP